MWREVVDCFDNHATHTTSLSPGGAQNRTSHLGKAQKVTESIILGELSALVVKRKNGNILANIYRVQLAN